MAKTKRPRDINQLAKHITDIATGDATDATTDNSAQRKGGIKGGKSRAEKLTSEQRVEIARKASQARWGKK